MGYPTYNFLVSFQSILKFYTSFLPRYLLWKETSVTRLGNLLDFGQLFKAFGNN